MKSSGFRKQSQDEIKQKQAIKFARNIESEGSQINSKALETPKGKKLRKKKSNLAKLKKQLWQLCREIQIKKYGSDCYTCPSKNLEGSSRHLGHFIPSSVCSTAMRYDLDNLRVQCYSCNIHKSGNWLAYERHLIQDGIDVQELKDRNEKTKGGMFREEWYKEQITKYQSLLSTTTPNTTPT